MIQPAVYNTSQIFVKKGVTKVVLSPGSRNAPLTISFARNSKVEIYNIVDERSAGFIALGMAQKSKEPVVLCCTSGTALLNYAPAIAEAYYQEIPLIVLSADRPSEWQGQRDGQTIQQPGGLTNFVKKTFELPFHHEHPNDVWEYYHRLNEAINLATTGKMGPVHINVPFREPFYPTADQELAFDETLPILQPLESVKSPDLSELVKEWGKFNKRLIVCGQQELSAKLSKQLKDIQKQAVVIGDIISNCGTPVISHHDLFLGSTDTALHESLQPDLLITFGKSVVSKNLKLFLRKYPAIKHWHFDPSLVQADPFQSMSAIIEGSVSSFFEVILDNKNKTDDFSSQVIKNFVQNWNIEDQKTNRFLESALRKADFSEFKAFSDVMQSLPGNIDLHLANSMPVRFANFIQGLAPKTEVFCNRGTSGIDGTNGTAVGNALVSDRITVLLTGDLSFFYDRNAFFHHYDMSKLKIIIFNNGGGGIFRLINGPSALPELEQHFETRHRHTAKFTALEYGFDYFKVEDEVSLTKSIKSAFKSDKTPVLVEIFTNPETNQRVYGEVKEQLK